jgi:hypothetical protein
LFELADESLDFKRVGIVEAVCLKELGRVGIVEVACLSLHGVHRTKTCSHNGVVLKGREKC